MPTTIHSVKPGTLKRTVNGREIAKASIVEENGIYQAVITDVNGTEYVSGSNSTDLASERLVLLRMLDGRK
jgi:hypothetical protein